jgi:hypothetical protein
MPASVVYGPVRFGGIGMIDLFTCQGAQMTTAYLFNTRALTGLGQQMLIAKDWAQLIAGTTNDILEYPNQHIPHEQGQWFVVFRHFLRETGCSIKNTTQGYITKLRRVNDRAIMDGCILKPAEAAIVNACCMYMKVETLADITTADGRELQQVALQLRSRFLDSKSTVLWPRQATPGEAAVKL